MIFFIGISFLMIYFTNGEIEEGQCLSRFDFDYKVMKKLLDLETEIAELRKNANYSREEPSVGFMAQLTNSIEQPKQGQVVVFDSVLTNVGKAYNPAQGTFIAGVDGIYNFHLFASSPKKPVGSWIHLFIMRNTEQVGYVYLDDNDDRWVGRSASVVVHLHLGDSVYVKIGQTRQSGTLAGCCFHTHFNGFLIQKD